MIPILYDSSETSFASNGLGRLRDCISCVVTEERNGVYECDFEYPISGSNYENIRCGRIIACTHDDSKKIQPFEIISYSRPLNGVVSFHAVHISYRQSGITAYGSGIESLADAFALLATGKPSNPFSYYTDKTSTGHMGAADKVPRTVRQMLGGVEGSILDTYGGEYEFDKWTVNLWSRRGVDRALTIRYGLNMIDFTDETDYSDTYSAVIPYWAGSDGKIRRGSLTSSGAATYNGVEICIPLDLTNRFENKPTAAQLNSLAATMITNAYKPSQTITVDFARLQDAEEYAQFKDLLKCNLCDTITLDVPMYNMQATLKIVKTVYNVLLNRYDSLELGTLSTTLSEALGISDSSVQSSTAEVGTVESAYLGTDKNCPNETGTALCSVELDAGVWVVTCGMRFPSNTTGIRRGNLSSTTGAITSDWQMRPATSGNVLQMAWTKILQPTATTTYYLNAYQNSGSTLSMPSGSTINYIKAVKII